MNQPFAETADRSASTATAIVTSSGAEEILKSDKQAVVDIVAATYAAHGEGRALNPPSVTLKLSANVADRGIALPAYVGMEDEPLFGMKWVTSRVDNLAKGLKRAHAVIVLNSPETGIPFAIVEGTAISAFRTAASAALAAKLCGVDMQSLDVGVVGAGYISATTLAFLEALGGRTRRICVYDSSDSAMARFRGYVQETNPQCNASFHTYSRVEEVIGGNPLTILATTSSSPYYDDLPSIAHHPVLLHLSLRDLAPSLLGACENVVDDREEATRPGTALGDAVATHGNAMISGTIGDLVRGRVKMRQDRCRVFSPYGMGILDVAIANYVYRQALSQGKALLVSDFSAK